MIGRSLIIAERVVRACVPDLAGRPLYILQPGREMLTRDMVGWRTGCYFRNLDRAFRPMLEAVGHWQGPGVGIAVDAEMIFAGAMTDDCATRAVIGITLHETAHWLDRPESA